MNARREPTKPTPNPAGVLDEAPCRKEKQGTEIIIGKSARRERIERTLAVNDRESAPAVNVSTQRASPVLS